MIKVSIFHILVVVIHILKHLKRLGRIYPFMKVKNVKTFVDDWSSSLVWSSGLNSLEYLLNGSLLDYCR